MGASGVLSDILPFVPGKDFYSYPYLYTAPTLQNPRKSSSGPRENARALKAEYERIPRQFNVGPREVLAQAKSDNTHTQTSTNPTPTRPPNPTHMRKR